MLLMTPALAQLRRERPAADLTLVCLARNAPIFEGLDLVDRVE